MNAPPFPTNPAVGEFYGNWVWNGVRWVCSPAAGVRVVIQTFTASGPYMPSQGLVTAVVECVGGGGGGGGAVGTFNGSVGWMVTAGGGGSGGYSRSALAAALVAGGVQVTVAAGGAGGAPPPPATAPGVPAPPFGGTGGDTTFGALCIAHGGGGGQGANPYGGAPGTVAGAGVGDISVMGNPGHAGQSLLLDSATGGNLTGGSGGAAFFGGAGIGAYVATNAAPGGAGTMGSGGGGAGSGTTTSEAGGAGGAGVCVVTEYCWADVAPDDECLNPSVNVNARVAVTHVPWQGPGPCPPGWGRDALEFEEG